MADVSHELGALRFVVDSPLSSKVAMFNNAATKHQEAQHLNPFSQSGGLPKPTFNKDEYGKPLAGSLTEARGQKANIHVLKEMLELCQIIDSEGYDVKDEPGMKVIPFGELFNIYTYISDKVVGILLRARKHKLIDFEGEVLFQRRDDDVPVFLLKPIKEIRQILEQKQDEIRRSVSPAPQATTIMLDQQKRAPSSSPTPVKQKAKKTDKPTENSDTKIIKPIAQKAMPIPTIEVQADQATTEVQNEIKVEILSKAAVIEPTTTAAPKLEEATAEPKPTVAPQTLLPEAPVIKPETPPTKVPASLTESTQTTLTAAAISIAQSPPETIVTPPTPTADAPAAVETTSTISEPNTAIVDEKTDINNNEEAPAIVLTVEASSNTEAEPPAEAAVTTVPNIA